MRTFVVILMLALATAMVIFGVQNTEPVNVRFLGIESGVISLSLVMVLSAVAGAALIGLINLYDRIRLGMRSRRVGKHLKSLEQERAELASRIAALEQENADLKLRSTELTRQLDSQRKGGAATPPASSTASPDR